MNSPNLISRSPAVVADVLLGIALTASLSLEISLMPGDAGARGFVAAVAVITGAAALLRARNRGRALAGGLLACAVAAVVSVVMELPSQPGVTASAALLVLGASYVRTAAARAGRLAAGAGIVVLVVGRLGLRSSLVLPVALLGVVAWGAALGLGRWLRVLDTHRRAAVDAARREERLLLARELHDVVAHHVAAIVIQAQAAGLTAAGRVPDLKGPLADIESAGTEALTAMRQIVSLLRDGEESAGLTPGPGELGDLIERFGAVRGRAVEARLPADQTTWAPEVRASVFRIVQESLTNIARHAPDAQSVRVRVDDDAFGYRLEILDDGRPSAGVIWLPRADGFGLVGMRERVEALGGSFDAGPDPDGGWAVRASIPRPEVPA